MIQISDANLGQKGQEIREGTERGKMKLSDEDISKVMCSDLPEQCEYSQIIYDAQETGKLINTPNAFDKCQEANRKAWSEIMNLMARCIARGMRLANKSGES